MEISKLFEYGIVVRDLVLFQLKTDVSSVLPSVCVSDHSKLLISGQFERFLTLVYCCKSFLSVLYEKSLNIYLSLL